MQKRYQGRQQIVSLELSMCRNQESIRPQTYNHDNTSINRQYQTRSPKPNSLPRLPTPTLRPQLPPPFISAIITLIILIVILFHQPLVVRGIGRGDLVVEEAWEDETDGCRASAADIREDLFKRGDSHGDDVATNDDQRRESREPDIAHNVRFRSLDRPAEQRCTIWRRR